MGFFFQLVWQHLWPSIVIKYIIFIKKKKVKDKLEFVPSLSHFTVYVGHLIER